MARRGFLAELQHQAQIAQRQRAQTQARSVREHAAAQRRAEQARKTADRARAQAARASETERKRFEREAAAAHVEARLAEVEEMNAGLAETYDEIDTLLEWTLALDDYVDLNTLRRAVEHPPFPRADLETPIPPPPPIPNPAEPTFMPPEQPKGVFGKKKRLTEATAAAEAAHAQVRAAWEAEMASLPGRRQAALEQHAAAEGERLAALQAERTQYEKECAAREAEVAKHNEAIDSLISNLGYGTAEAVQEYVSIVLANSVYPDHFKIEHDFSFEPATAELRLKVRAPAPDTVPDIKAYKYTKASDEITTTTLTQKAVKDRYAGAVHQVALRSLHEVFEADRRGLIRTISLEVGAETIDPATGRLAYTPFVAVCAERATFVEFDLSAVVPTATLERLGAVVSRNPHGLVSIDPSGIRRT